MSAPATEALAEVLEDYEGEESRYAIYVVSPHPIYAASRDEPNRRRIAETSLDGIGLTLFTLRAEKEIGDDSRVGIFDRFSRVWLVNPWAKGDLG